MEHGKALVVKGVLTLVVLYLVLGIGYGASFGSVLLLTLFLGGISYLAGDLFILPKAKNLPATFADLVLTYFVVWGGCWLVHASGWIRCPCRIHISGHYRHRRIWIPPLFSFTCVTEE